MEIKLRTSKILFFVGILTLSVGLSGCLKPVSPLPADQDKPPIITVTSLPVGGSNEVNNQTVTSGTQVSVVPGTKVMILASAQNPGGVKELTLKFHHGVDTVSVVTGATAYSSGKVPQSLEILGTNGMGGTGNTPIELLDTPAQSSVPLSASVEVSATNFNGMKTEFVVIYVPWWQAPQIRELKAQPDYINIGDSSQLTWLVTNCGPYCRVRIEGRDGLSFADLVEAQTNLPASGSLPVKPTRSTLTRYTLITSDPHNGDHSSTKTVDVTLAPSNPPKGRVYFFRMENPGSAVRPCFTIAIYAPDSTTAKQLAESQNGGFAATEINESQYVNGC